MADDQLAARLEQIRRRIRNAEHGDTHDLLAAVERVLALHYPRTVAVRHLCAVHSGAAVIAPGETDACPDCSAVERAECAECDPMCPDDNVWPCATVAAISGELLGEEESDGHG